MTSMQRKQHGLTLLEVMLVLAVGVSIILLSIQQYLSYRRDADAVALVGSVDVLFGALGRYFQANCRNAPFNNLYSGKTYPVSLATLVNGGYLATQEVPPLNPIVNYGGSATSGYVLQFNQVQVTNPTGLPLPQRTIKLQTGGSPVNMGNILLWQAQVAVNLRDPLTAPQYKNILAADCLSSYSGGVVLPCTSAASGSTQFAVWSRLPSMSSSENNSNYWLTIPTVKQFNQMYTTYPILVLTDGTKTVSQFYMCGT